MSLEDKQLYELSRDQAVEILEAFLRVERECFSTLCIGNVTLDYTQLSVTKAIRHIAVNEFGPNQPAYSEPNPWYARLGYYFGESLCRAADHLYWSSGEANTAFENH